MDKESWDKERITWVASYPKSGNTWVRSLLQAYRCGGYLNLNDLHTAHGDSSACYTQAVSPIPVDSLKLNGQLMLRPAALLTALMAKPVPRMFKTHFANLKEPGVPAFIPFEFTERAIYIVRDPRDIALSFSKYFGLSMDKTVEQMAHKEHWIGGGPQSAQVISSWSNHVASWGGEKAFPVHYVKYEELMENPVKELTEIIEFLKWDMDDELIAKAVSACELSKMKKHETEKGFAENTRADERGTFFNAGGTRWQHELGQKWIDQIEQDHGDVMRAFGYLEKKAEIKAVN